jgi:hypothetical protein
MRSGIDWRVVESSNAIDLLSVLSIISYELDYSDTSIEKRC